MSAETRLMSETSLPFAEFWRWLQGHTNCIVSVSTPDAVLYDHNEFHWLLTTDEESGNLLVQVVRGKEIVGEVAIVGREVGLVRCEARGEEEFLFECMSAADPDESAYAFTLSHDYNTEAEARPGKWVH